MSTARATRFRSHLVFTLAPLLLACQAPDLQERSSRREASVARVVAVTRSAPDPIRIEPLGGESPPIFVMRGAPHGAQRLVFLHGMCGHGLGYAQSFAHSAARYGLLIAPQGDVSCGDGLSKWSNDLASLDARIKRAFEALGDPDPRGELVIIGMSQGATRAAQLAQLHPDRYTRLISMAAPSAIKPGELPRLRSAVTMAGQLDRQDLMRESARALTASRVPATFVLIPNAAHGAMGPTPEETMREALDWLFAH